MIHYYQKLSLNNKNYFEILFSQQMPEFMIPWIWKKKNSLNHNWNARWCNLSKLETKGRAWPELARHIQKLGPFLKCLKTAFLKIQLILNNRYIIHVVIYYNYNHLKHANSQLSHMLLDLKSWFYFSFFTLN